MTGLSASIRDMQNNRPIMPVLFRDLDFLIKFVLPDHEIQKPIGAVETIDAKEW